MDHRRDGAGELEPGAEFVLRLLAATDERPSGTLTRLGETVPHPFSGWLELMALVDRLRSPETA